MITTMKKNSKLTLITSVICLLPMILSAVLYEKLPQEIAVHWGNDGVPNGYMPKGIAAFGIPLFLCAINIFSKIQLFNDPKRANHENSKAIEVFAVWVIPVISVIIVPVTLFIALGANIPIWTISGAVVGCIFVVLGNYLPKCRQNYTVGIKLPWTLSSADNWDKTHRAAGYTWILGGFAVIVCCFVFQQIQVLIPVVILMILVPILYSYILFKTRGREIK